MTSLGPSRSAPLRYPADENGTNIFITVVRQGGIAGTVTVDFATADGTAFAGTDYVATSGTLTFGPGELSKSFDVFLIDNSIQDGNRTLNLVLSNPTAGASLGPVPAASLLIIDDESFNVAAGTLDATFRPGTGPNLPVYTIQLQANSNLLVGGEFTSYDNVPERSLTRLLPDGALDTTFNVGTGFNDQLRAMVLQPDGRLVMGGFFTNFNLVNRRYVARLYPDGALDESFNPGAGADNPVYAVAVQPGDSRILIGGSFNTFNGVYRPNLARLNTNGTLHAAFNVGNGPDGTVFALALQADGKILIGGDFTHVNNIPRDRIARLNPDGSLDPTFLTGAGADATVRAIQVQSDGSILVGGSFTNFAGQGRAFLVRLQPADGAVDGTFLAGLAGPDEAVYAIALQPDEKIVLGGSFSHVNGVTRNRITRLNKDGTTDPSINFGLGANGFVAALLIQPDRKIVLGGGFTTYDNKPANHLARIYGGSLRGNGSIEFSTPFYSVVEDQPVVILQVLRRGGTFGDTTVTYTTFDGSAVDGIDYVGAADVTLSFQQGEVLQSISLPIIDDNLVEGPKTAYLLLDNPTGGADIGAVPLAVLTILDNDCAVGFDNTIYSVAENVPAGTAPIRVIRTGAPDLPVSVDYFALPGTADTNKFVPVSGTLNFLSGETEKVFQVPILNELLVEGTKSVLLFLTNAQPTNVCSVSLGSAVLNITDDERAPGEIVFSSAAYSANESATNAVITVIRTNGTTGIVSVRYDTSDGTATNGIDYRATSGYLSFADGESLKVFNVPVLDDHKPGPDKTVNLALSQPGGGAILGALSNAVLTVLENQPGASYFGFAAAVLGAYEFDPYAFVTIVRTNSRRGLATVSFSTQDGTAINGLNYVGTNVTVTFYDNQGATNVLIPILQDQLGTPDLTVQLHLSNPSAGNFIAMSNALLVITNDDTSFQFAAPAYSVPKNATNLVITVRRSGLANATNSVDYSTLANGNAVAGLDYVPVSGTLTWASNEPPAKTFLVPIIYHAGFTPDKTFSVTLANAVGPTNTYVGAPSNAVVTIVNNDVGVPPAGDVDPAFNYLVGANAPVHAVAYDAARQLYVGGDFTYMGGLGQNHLTRLTTNGTVDSAFAIGSGFDSSVYAVALAADTNSSSGGGTGSAAWQPRATNRYWTSIACSSDGMNLVATAGTWDSNGLIHTSTDGGLTWVPRDTARHWRQAASSADGTKLVAVEYGWSGGYIYTSTDAGVTWTPRQTDALRHWWGVASSADGTKLVATEGGGEFFGYIYTSTDSGVTWTARESSRHWMEVASSDDGTKLVAAVMGGQIYTSTDSGATWIPRDVQPELAERGFLGRWHPAAGRRPEHVALSLG